MKRTLRRLGTDYLDIFYLHDVEFVATQTSPLCASVNSATAIHDEKGREVWGLESSNTAKVWGAGDRIVLEAYDELRKLREEGLVRSIGIAGTVLRVSTHHQLTVPQVSRFPFSSACRS